jgi:hypothetical protein
MKSLRIAAAIILLGCGPAFAQVGMTTSPTPRLEATSPIGMSPGAPVAQTGIPVGIRSNFVQVPGLLASGSFICRGMI